VGPMQWMNHPEQAVLALYLAGRLSTAEMARLEEHLATCPICPAVLDEIPEDTMVGAIRHARGRIGESLSEALGANVGTSDVLAPADPGSAGSLEAKPAGAARLPRELSGHPRYVVKHLLAHGGMGLVFVADDRQGRGTVALKFLREELLDHPQLLEPRGRSGVPS